jgi:gliding motility-associated-like protein
MKRWVFIVMLILYCLPALSKHVAGGELFYEYLGPGSPGMSNYRITLRLFRDCGSTGPILQIEDPKVGIYENGLLLASLTLPITGPVKKISLNTKAFPCLVGQVDVCYEMAIYTATISLSDNLAGYTLSRVGCCRVDFISNLSQPTTVGANYVTRIPGKNNLPTGHNSSPQFNVRDTALVCANKSFKLDFGANDADGDSLTYALCNAYTAGAGNNNAPPPAGLNLVPLPYASSFSGSSPLGSKVSINAATGIISGIAPGQGQYVVNVCITEWRNGKAFTEHRKDFILKIQECDIIEAVLPEKIIQCDNFSVFFENQSTSSFITSYSWDFGIPGAPGNTSSSPTQMFTYPDTGRYIARLRVTGPAGCQGDASTEVLVYPGFKAGFTVAGSCFQNPYQFTDATTAAYGVADSWRWDFGDNTTNTDTSTRQNPAYKYIASSRKDVTLIVTSSKGCIDTAHQELIVKDKPSLLLPFKDTLICSIDTLAIPVGNSGVISWLPNYNIVGANTSAPWVFPKDTTKYLVTVNDNGCINTDTVTVNVLDFIEVFAGSDSVICRNDGLVLRPVSHALGYQWTSSSGEPVAAQKFPAVRPLVNTTYYVTANLGKCQDKDTVNIKVVNYPTSRAGNDTIICFGGRAMLRASIIGSSFSWSPTASLNNPNSLNPLAIPPRTTAYVLRVTDTMGCPKPATDTVIVSVTPTILANAGPDTTVVPNQPLQLEASGGMQYNWSPEYGLSSTDIYNPVATLDESVDSILYKVRVFGDGGCYADDEVMVKVHKTAPDIIVPSAFSPNGDGKNDILKPFVIGITQLQYFRVYNRWGQLLFSTNQTGKGWDGSFSGVKQSSNTYVYQAEGIDFRGKKVYRKGTIVLIR